MFRLVLLTILLSPPPDEWKAKFHEEAPNAWAKYATRARRLQGSLVVTTRSLDENKIVYSNHFELKQREGCSFFLEQYGVEGGDEEGRRGQISAVNPYYAFTLKRKTSESPWAAAGAGKELWNAEYAPSHLTEWILRAPYTFVAIVNTLEARLDDPEFSINKVAPVDDGDGQFLKVEFKYDPVKNKNHKPLRSGWVLLDTKRYWVMRAFEARTLWGDGSRDFAARFEYNDTPDDFPILKTILVTAKIPTKNRSFESVYSYQLQERDLPEREFRISAFGFPEPPGAPRIGTPWYVWFIALAFASLAVGWYFRRRMAKSKPAPGPNPATGGEGSRA